MADTQLLSLLNALAAGQTIWLSADGLSMWPVFLAGDQLRLVRCGEEDVLPGDVVVRQYGDALVGHLVTSRSPLVTAGVLGAADPPGGVVLGRVDAVRRAGLEVPLPRVLRHVVRRVPALARVVRHLPGARPLVNLLRR